MKIHHDILYCICKYINNIIVIILTIVDIMITIFLISRSSSRGMNKMMNRDHTIIKRVVKIIQSCTTHSQLETANTYSNLAIKYYSKAILKYKIHRHLFELIDLKRKKINKGIGKGV